MSTGDELYALLPAVHRLRDAEPRQGRALRGLLAVLGEQADVLSADIDRLYDNWFIETCDDWVVTYIGELLGARPLHPVGPAVASPRAYVANTLAYRRRKGTAAVIEQLAFDVTGWQARAVEFFELLATTQHVNHLRPHALRTPDLRRGGELELLGLPFERAGHTGEARRPGRGGRYGILNLGVFLWRLAPFQVRQGSVRAVTTPPDGRFRVHPVGLDAPLFNPPRTETEITHLAEERDMPGPLRRRPLYEELEARRQALARGAAPPPALWFGADPVFRLHVEQAGELRPVPAEELLVCDLSDAVVPPPQGWRRPPASRAYRRDDGTAVNLPITAAVDPVLGRVAFPDGVDPGRVEVDYVYAAGGELGGGPYGRGATVPADLLDRAGFLRAVSKHARPVTGLVVTTVRGAVQAWNQQPPGTVGVIAILDSATYPEQLIGASGVRVPAGSELLLVAAGWPQADAGNPPASGGIAQLVFDNVRPHLGGGVEVTGTPGPAGAAPGRLVVNGLLVEGPVTVLPGDLGELVLAHSTVAPPAGVGLTPPGAGQGDNATLAVTLERAISGPLALDGCAGLLLRGSVIDAAGGVAVSARDAVATIEASTILGRGELRELHGSDSIFSGTVRVLRRQQGCVRFSSLPAGSVTPRRYRCQPDLAGQAAEARLAPAFTSTRYGDAGYAQLSDFCAEELRAGAADGAEMGAFQHLRQPQRERNLRAALDEHLRAGLEAGVFHVT